MILFRPEHVAMILSGRKTQTRRKGSRRWKVGSYRKCYTKPPFTGGEPFATVRIIGLRREQLGQISSDDAFAEGYRSVDEYLTAYRRIYKVPISKMVTEMDSPVWVVDFELQALNEEAGR